MTRAEEEKARAGGAILTADDRQRWLKGLKRGSARPLSRVHLERLKQVYTPFPEVRRLGGGLGAGSAMPWAGTIVTDTFFGTNDKPRGKRGDGRDGFYEGNGQRADGNTMYEALYRDALAAYEEDI